MIKKQLKIVTLRWAGGCEDFALRQSDESAQRGPYMGECIFEMTR